MPVSLDVAFVDLPNNAGVEELQPLFDEPSVIVRRVLRAEDLGAPDMVVIPGTEATLADLAWLRERGLDRALLEAASRGSVLFGICGGFQMLGSRLLDPERVEKGAGEADGLSVFEMETRFTRDLIDEPVTAQGGGGFLAANESVSGWEEHGGRSVMRGDVLNLLDRDALGGTACPLMVATRDMGAFGTYLHGVLADTTFRRRLLDHLRERRSARG
jgi:adenosylcobyric acid synthase